MKVHRMEKPAMKNETQAQVSNIKQISIIWLVPIMALVIGLWMLYEHLSQTGPEITLKMSDASGLEVGKTEIRYLSVKVGVVSEVKLSGDYDHIVVKAQMDKDAQRMLREDTLFWVVKPRIGTGGISGLDTILSGSYIEVQAGRAQAEQFEFTVLDVPPVAPADAKGLRVVLSHNRAGRLPVGAPVIYHGFVVGRVEKVSFDVKQDKALYQLFIYQPYDDLVRSGTRFWINSGIDLQLNTEGFKLRFDSLESLLAGGVSFGIPKGENSGELVTEDLTQFALFDDLQAVQEGLYSQYINYAMLFSESIRGLNPGAPVEYHGLRVGSVEKVPLFKAKLEELGDTESIAVLIKIEPKRIFVDEDGISNQELRKELQAKFKHGLKGSLKTGSLLTGALYIDLDYDTTAQAYTPEKLAGYDIFPSKKGGLAQVQKQVMDIIEKVNNLPFDKTVSSMNSSLNALQKTLVSAENAVNSVHQLVEQEGVQSLPDELQQSLDQIQQTLNGFTPNSSVYQNLNKSLAQLQKVMTGLQPVLRQLNEKPNSLVFGGDKLADPIPVKGGK